MNFLTKGLFIVFVLHGSNAGLFSNSKNLINQVSGGVHSNVNSIVNTVSITEVTHVLDNLSLTKGGMLDIDGLMNKLNLSSVVSLIPADGIINVKNLIDSFKLEEFSFASNIISAIQKSITADGKLNVKTLIDSLKFEDFNFASIFSLINTQISEGIGKIMNQAIGKIMDNVDFIDYLTSILVTDSEDGKLDFTGLATKYIGKIKTYEVTTEDGYVLKLFRIPGDVSNTVLVNHGIFGSADDALLRGNTSLIYSLVQNNCDVWAINFRGNSYSRKHLTLDPDTDSKFWEFSIHEWGHKDLPAVIDFVLKKTKQQKLSVIGYSAGSASTLILTSTRPEYNDKIKVFVALSPVCYLSNAGLVLTALIRAEPILNELLVIHGVNEIFGKKKIEKKIYRLVCSQGLVSYKLCYQLGLGTIYGYNPDNIEPTFYKTSLGHFPEGTSKTNLIHYLQIGNSGRFAQYDYGRDNFEIYDCKEPPVYDLQKTTCGVSIIVSPNDNVLGLEDAERVRNELPNVVDYHVVEDKKFNHVDILYGYNAYELVYPRVINTLNKYSTV